MDLDAVLARRPQVAPVDELAHTNVPGCRNAKPWQDIDELLDARGAPAAAGPWSPWPLAIGPWLLAPRRRSVIRKTGTGEKHER
jgi:hypothetical protein